MKYITITESSLYLITDWLLTLKWHTYRANPDIKDKTATGRQTSCYEIFLRVRLLCSEELLT